MMGARDGRRTLQVTLLDRVVLIVVALFLVALAVWTAVSGYGWRGVGSAAPVWESLGVGVLEATVIGLVLLLAGLHVLFLAIQREEDDGIRHETELGHVRISLRAIETLVRRSAKEVRGIKEVDVKVVQSPEGVAVRLALIVLPEVSVPRISTEVSRRVQAHVRETIGVDVGNVGIEIKNIAASEPRPRVE